MGNAIKAVVLVAVGAAGAVAGGVLLRPPPGAYEAHAVDLRRVRTSNTITVQAWGGQVLVDGGYKDVGGGASCVISDKATQACISQIMNAASSCIHE